MIVFEPVRNRHPPNPSSTAVQMPGLMSRWHLCIKKRSSSPSSCWTQLLTQTGGLASGMWAGFQPFTPLLRVPLSRAWPTQVYLAYTWLLWSQIDLGSSLSRSPALWLRASDLMSLVLFPHQWIIMIIIEPSYSVVMFKWNELYKATRPEPDKSKCFYNSS